MRHRRSTAAVLTVALAAAACASPSDRSALPSTTAATRPGAGPTSCVVDPPVVWIEEGQRAEATLDCGSMTPELAALDRPDVITDGPDVAWTPRFDQSGVHEIELTGNGKTALWTVGVADAFDQPDNRPVADPARLTHEFELEVMHLYTDDPISADYANAQLVHLGRRYDNVEVRVRGALSLEYPKPSLGLRFAKGFASPDPAFDGLDRLVLVAGFDDNSSLRNRLAQEVWADFDDSHLSVPNASVVVYLDGDYLGLYTMLENINQQYLERRGLEPGGQLFKANDHRADFWLDDDPDPAAGFEKKVGEPELGPLAMSAIEEVVEFADGASDAVFARDIGEMVSVDDVIDWLVFVSFISAGDSAGKNAYWYQDADGSPFRYVPWDFNHSFGQDYATNRLAPDVQGLDEFVARNALFARLDADEGWRETITERYQAALDGPLSTQRLNAHVDRFVAEIGANFDRDERRWGEAYADFRMWPERVDLNTTADEIEYLRDWIDTRHGVVGGQVAAR